MLQQHVNLISSSRVSQLESQPFDASHFSLSQLCQAQEDHWRIGNHTDQERHDADNDKHSQNL
jgi:hypothetical protein